MSKHGRGYWWDAKAKRWRVRFALGAHGRSHRESLGSEWTEKQVIEHVANLRKQAVLGTLGRQDHLISEVLDVFLERAESFKGYEKLRSHVKAIWPWIHGKRLSDVGEIARDYRRFHRTKLSGSTINRRIALLRRLANIAWKELAWLDRPIHFEITPEQHRTTHLTMDQVEDLVSRVTHQPTKDAIWIAVCTGWRMGELWSLTQEHVRDGCIYIVDTKNSEPRISPIHNRIKDAVKRLPFPVSTRAVFRHFKVAAREIGMPSLRFHDLRHTTASLIINAGGTLKDVQEVLGHKSVATSNRYSHMLVERKKTVLDMALAKKEVA